MIAFYFQGKEFKNIGEIDIGDRREIPITIKNLGRKTLYTIELATDFEDIKIVANIPKKLSPQETFEAKLVWEPKDTTNEEKKNGTISLKARCISE